MAQSRNGVATPCQRRPFTLPNETLAAAVTSLEIGAAFGRVQVESLAAGITGVFVIVGLTVSRGHRRPNRADEEPRREQRARDGDEKDDDHQPPRRMPATVAVARVWKSLMCRMSASARTTSRAR
jgi:hypothetical protein